MSGWDGSGVFTRVYSWVADAAANIDISSSRMDTDTDNITSNGFSNCLTRDGQGIATANLPMGGFKHTNVANGVAASDYAAFGQIQSGVSSWAVAGGTSDAITASFTPAVTSLTDGILLWVRAAATNLTSVPTFSPNGLTAHPIVRAAALIQIAIGDIVAATDIGLRYNASASQWVLVNTPSIPVGGMVPFFGASVPQGFALPQGQNLSATTFPAANAVLGTTYGSPGGGNFTMPDLRGRVPAGLDAGGSGRITVAGGNFDGTTLGTAGGAQNKSITVAQANLPNYALNSYVPGTIATNQANIGFGNLVTSTTPSGANNATVFQFGTASSGQASVSLPSYTPFLGGSGAALVPAIVQPTMVCNWMMRIA